MTRETRPTTMWEAAATEGGFEVLTAWLRSTVAAMGLDGVELYRSDDHRLVALLHSSSDEPVVLPSAPQALLRRPAHQWNFWRLEQPGSH